MKSKETFNAKEINNKQIKSSLENLLKQPIGFIYSKTSQQTPKKNINKTEAIKKLYTNFENCTKCPLAKQGRNKIVFGEGNHDADLMFVGEGPGRDEDKQGIPFIGRAGKLLTKIIESMQLTRDQVYITNVVKCRPPNNRNPLPIESETCKKLLLLKEIEIINPKIICTLGAIATKALLGEDIRISKARGVFSIFKGITLMPTYHPAYLLRNPSAKKIVWEDMKLIMNNLKNNSI